MIEIPQQVKYVLFELEKNSYKAYLVGGSVRDYFLNKKPHDFDVASNAPLSITQSIFPNSIIIGAAFGVCLVNIDGLEIQIAQFRSDGKYSDYRHPDEVCFVDDILEDLKRRDFTINAMAWNPKETVYVEKALEDLNGRLIRAVGNPAERFQEDPLRMLRAVRFACQIDFTIESKTGFSISQNAHLIQNISSERIQEELNKILLSYHSFDGISLLHILGLEHFVFPELETCINVEQNKFHQFDVHRHILETLKNTPEDLIMRLTALLHDIGKPNCKNIDNNGDIHFYRHEEISAQMAKIILMRLKYDNSTIEEVCHLVLHHMDFLDFHNMTDKAIRKAINRHGLDRLKKLIIFRRSDLLGSGNQKQEEVDKGINQFLDRIDMVMSYKPPTKYEDLAISGNDIMKLLDLKPGKKVGEIKDYLMNIVLEDPKMNNKDDLTNLLLKYI